MCRGLDTISGLIRQRHDDDFFRRQALANQGRFGPEGIGEHQGCRLPFGGHAVVVSIGNSAEDFLPARPFFDFPYDKFFFHFGGIDLIDDGHHAMGSQIGQRFEGIRRVREEDVVIRIQPLPLQVLPHTSCEPGSLAYMLLI